METLSGARCDGNGIPKPSLQRERALEYAAKGLRVFPVYEPISNDQCSCRRKPSCDDIGKHPRNRNGFKGASSDRAKVLDWWLRWPRANIGIATGRESGIWVLDFDGKEGAAFLRELCREHGEEWLETLTATTGRGRHLYFRYPANREIGNRTGVRPGLDVRGKGGYVIAPGSIHEFGSRYEWVDPNAPIAAAPEWLLELVTTKTPRRSPGQTIPKGTRHDAFLHSAGYLRGHLGMEPAAIEATLLREKAPLCASPMTADRRKDTRRIANDIGKLPTKVDSADVLPLDDFVAVAIEKNKAAYEHREKWHSPFFYFAKRLKSRTEFAGKDALSAAKLLDAVLTKSSSEGVDHWEHHFGNLHVDDPRSSFIAVWDVPKLTETDSPLQDAYDEAIKRPLFPSEDISPGYSQFISVVGHRQRATPGVPIPISGEAFGGLLGYHHTTISDYLSIARRFNLLTWEKQSSYTKGRASEYLFRLDQWDWDSGHQLELPSPGSSRS